MTEVRSTYPETGYSEPLDTNGDYRDDSRSNFIRLPSLNQSGSPNH